MGGGKSGSVTVGYRYYMSMHFGLCRGPIDEIVQINVADVRAWPVPDGDSESTSGLATIAQGPGGQGVRLYEDGTSELVAGSEINTISDSGIFSINAGSLFGGDKKEGGIEGPLHVMMGQATQVVSSWIKGLMGGLVPDFRGVATLFFDGLICSLNPYPKPWQVRVRRTVSGWDGEVWQPTLATIWLRDATIKAMNPAHIIYECLTNRAWGRGFPRSFINYAKFLPVAQKLHDEGLGLCLRWNRQDELGDFIQEIIDHIGGSMYQDRTTGLINLDLLRGDYDVATLPTFTYDTGLLSIDDDETASRDDLVNEVIINWHDPIKNEDRQARLHNLASLQSLGAVKSTTTSYDGLPTADLALRIGQRDLKTTSTSLKRFKVKLDRRAWKIIPGSVFKISAPDKNIFSVVLRAGKVTETGGTDGSLVVDAVLDVFGLPAASFIAGQGSEWTPPNRSAVIPSRRYVREGTYSELMQRLSPADLALVDPLSGVIATMASKPTDLTQSYTLATRADGEDYVRRGAASFVPSAVIDGSIGRYDTVIDFTGGVELGLIELGTEVQIGTEICRLDDITTSDGFTGTITVGRGCVDTLPVSHSSGAVIFFVSNDGGTDTREYVTGETVDVKLLSVTSTQELNISLAPADEIVIAARQGRPWPPADVRVNGSRYGDISGVTGAFTITWKHRDRTIIQDQLFDHQAASIGPEAGTTYTIRIYGSLSFGTPKRTVTGIAGATWTYTVGMAVDDDISGNIGIELEAVRGGVTSLMRYRFGLAYADDTSAAPSNLSAFSATGPTTGHLSASTGVAANTGFVQFFRTAHGVALNPSTNKIGGEIVISSSSTVTYTDTPGPGSYDYYARPISPSHVNGAISGPINVVLT